mmetsp:Transcript_8765/g.15486  ORF Transcript_8765/g.15486 Transcript_8765/m.15486 type:complete len:148 (+) Transcript_8765:476-919(+)
MLKEEFFSRTKQKTEELGVDERHALPCEIKQEQELKFKWQAKQKKKHRQSTSDRNDVLERLDALRSQNQMYESERQFAETRIGERRQKQRQQRRGGLAQSFASMATPKHRNSKHNLMADCKNEEEETEKKQENDNLTEYHDPAYKSG